MKTTKMKTKVFMLAVVGAMLVGTVSCGADQPAPPPPAPPAPAPVDTTAQEVPVLGEWNFKKLDIEVKDALIEVSTQETKDVSEFIHEKIMEHELLKQVVMGLSATQIYFIFEVDSTVEMRSNLMPEVIEKAGTYKYDIEKNILDYTLKVRKIPGFIPDGLGPWDFKFNVDMKADKSAFDGKADVKDKFLPLIKPVVELMLKQDATLTDSMVEKIYNKMAEKIKLTLIVNFEKREQK